MVKSTPKPMPKKVAALVPWLVFFDFDRANIADDSRLTLNQVIAAAKQSSGAPVVVIGHTDLVGETAYNLALSKRRADAVVKALVEGGVASNRIRSSGVGKAEPMVSTAMGVREVLNRRVQIRLVK